MIIAVQCRNQDGSATLMLPIILWVATLVAVVVIDIGAYLAAAARAQTLADGAALAAIRADIPGASGGTPRIEAARIASAAAGVIEDCECRPGRERVRVTASVEVPGLVLPTLGASRVAAEASAVLAPPKHLDTGPTRQRARWPIPVETGGHATGWAESGSNGALGAGVSWRAMEPCRTRRFTGSCYRPP